MQIKVGDPRRSEAALARLGQESRDVWQLHSGLNLALALPRCLAMPKPNTWRNSNNVIVPHHISPGGKLTWAQESVSP